MWRRKRGEPRLCRWQEMRLWQGKVDGGSSVLSSSNRGGFDALVRLRILTRFDLCYGEARGCFEHDRWFLSPASNLYALAVCGFDGFLLRLVYSALVHMTLFT
ncbi:hypothetical protein Tsubulata_019837, partial [Turnera subulata]